MCTTTCLYFGEKMQSQVESHLGHNLSPDKTKYGGSEISDLDVRSLKCQKNHTFNILVKMPQLVGAFSRFVQEIRKIPGREMVVATTRVLRTPSQPAHQYHGLCVTATSRNVYLWAPVTHCTML